MSKKKIKSPVHNALLVLIINSKPESNGVMLCYCIWAQNHKSYHKNQQAYPRSAHYTGGCTWVSAIQWKGDSISSRIHTISFSFILSQCTFPYFFPPAPVEAGGRRKRRGSVCDLPWSRIIYYGLTWKFPSGFVICLKFVLEFYWGPRACCKCNYIIVTFT